VGHENGGILTDAARRKPYCVILLDEFEKAHREVSNLLLQVFDEGRLSDSHGKVADFRNTVIILTANLGSDILYADKSLSDAEGVEQSRAKLAMTIVNSAFSPEFVNRLDEVICFAPLDAPSIRKIADIQLEKVRAILLEKKIALRVTDKAAQWLAETGYSSEYGARPLRRLIQNVVLNPLAFLVLEDKITAGATVIVQDKDEAVAHGMSPLEIHAKAQSVGQTQASALRFFFA
jgi:ATP-dependent Clp protease ATP-binding subunit ClpB